MRRRNVLRRIGAASAVAIGGTGVTAASGGAGIRWQFEDGHVEKLSLAEFRSRSDTPTAAQLGGDPADILECCACKEYPIDCMFCLIPRCDGDDPYPVQPDQEGE